MNGNEAFVGETVTNITIVGEPVSLVTRIVLEYMSTREKFLRVFIKCAAGKIWKDFQKVMSRSLRKEKHFRFLSELIIQSFRGKKLFVAV